MGKFKDIDCPICNSALENGEDIVICDICGAPYHRKCIAVDKRCIYADLHRLGESWEMPKPKEEEAQKFAGDEPKRCSRCGTINPINGLFCEVCGNTLNSSEAQQQNFNKNMGAQMPGAQPFNPMASMGLNPFTTPFGGVNPDEIIDDVSVKDLTIFVNQNTPYFIPKFKQHSDNPKSTSFNFAAFIFTGIYFLYRKMYALGILFLALTVITALPAYIIQFDNLQQTMGMQFFDINIADWMYTANFIFSVLNLLAMFFCGAFANKLYKNHCVKKIKTIEKTYTEHEEYNKQLTKQGSVSKTVIFILLGLYFVWQICLFLLLMAQS